MTNDPDDGEMVRLVIDGRTISEGRWRGPYRPGEVIHSMDFGEFTYDHCERPDDGGEPVFVYTRLPI